MTKREKFIQRVCANDRREVELAEVHAFLINEGCKVRRTTHSYLYSKGEFRITFCTNNKVLHPAAKKDLRIMLSKLGFDV